MRPRVLYLLLAVFLLLVGVCPAIASVIGDTAGLMLAGALELLAEPAVLGAVLVALFFTTRRRRHPHVRPA